MGVIVAVIVWAVLVVVRLGRRDHSWATLAGYSAVVAMLLAAVVVS